MVNDINKFRAIPGDFVFLVEKSDPLKSVGKYQFEGICAKFGVENQNKRIYEKDEYLPHLSYLKEKINSRRLLGELDHPQSYDISLQNISHIIEDLWYESSDNTVRIRISLLDTPKGQIARSLADAGVPLSISSRAAGQVANEGKVKLHQIFTFDLVAEPGFAEAVLQPSLQTELKENFSMVTESLTNLKQTSILNKLEDISESSNLGNNIKIYKINKEDEKFFEQLKENNSNKMSEFLTKDEFNQYTDDIKKMFTDKLGQMTENFNKIMEEKGDEEVTDLPTPPADDTDGDTPTEAPDEIPGEDGAEESGEDTAETTELENIQPDDDKDAVIRKLSKYVNFLAGQIDGLIGFTNYLAEMQNRSINYTENVGEMANSLADHNNHLSEKINQAINYMNKVATTTNEGLNHNDYLAKIMNMIIGHNDVLAEKINQLVDFSDFHRNITEDLVNYSNYMRKAVNSRDLSGNEIKTEDRELSSNVASITESKEVDTSNSIQEEISSLIKEIKSESTDAVLEQKYPFLKLLSEDNKNKFYELDKETKTDVIATLENAVYFTEKDVIELINQVVEHKSNAVPMYLRYMPEKYKELYEQINESEKSTIEGQASLYNMTTSYHVKSFWDQLDLGQLQERIFREKNAQEQAKNAATINESQSKEDLVPAEQVVNMRRGYSLDFVKSIGRFSER